MKIHANGTICESPTDCAEDWTDIGDTDEDWADQP